MNKHDFVLKEVIDADMQTELEKVGFDKSYIEKGSRIFEFKNIKIYSLSSAQANILKQTAISVGGECATHREVITGKIEKSDCILCGTISQIGKIASKLNSQPFGLNQLGAELEEFISKQCDNQTKIMGILNLTPNSFSDGGMYDDFESAKKHLLEMIEDGADIIDIGAESTKPFSNPVDEQTQLEKLIPIVEFAKDKTTISIDTRSARVAEECIKAGAQIINDVSGLTYDKNMANTCAKYDVKVIIQHSQGTPENMQISPHYDSVMDELYLSLKDSINYAVSAGIKKGNIILDPGIGFGKKKEHNFEIIKRIEEFRGLGCPVMLGLSRKSLLGMADEDNDTKDIFTVALNTLGVERKVDYIRVHNVKLHRTLLNLMQNF